MSHRLATEQANQGETGTVEPKEIVTLLYKPNHRLFQVAFEAEITICPLGKLRDVLNTMGIRILTASMSCPDGRIESWNVFLDSEDCGITGEALRPKLEAITSLRGLRLTEGDELVVDEFFFPMFDSMGNRVMIITQEAFQRMISALESLLGSGGNWVVYQDGLAMGSANAGGIRTLIRGDRRKLMGELARLYTATGTGIAEVVEMDLDNLRFVIRVIKNVECDGKHSDGPNSQWIRGRLAGSASTILGVPMECVETKCIAAGDPYCEFELSKSQTAETKSRTES